MNMESKVQTLKSHGFHWTYCQCRALSEANTVRDIRDCLQHIPESLSQTYEMVLKAIPRCQRGLARNTLFWAAHASRPLSLNELSEAVPIDEQESVIDEEARFLRKETMLDICGSLISFDSLTKDITLAHSSVLDYLSHQKYGLVTLVTSMLIYRKHLGLPH